MNISQHAIEQYCIRKYADGLHYVSNPVKEELGRRLAGAVPSDYNPKEFFHGRKGIKAKDITLIQDDEYIYAIRDDTLITVLNIPRTNMISDFINKNR